MFTGLPRRAGSLVRDPAPDAEPYLIPANEEERADGRSMPLPCAWTRRRRGRAAAGLEIGDAAAARQEQALHAAMTVFRRFDARHSGREVDDEFIAAQHVLALGHDDVAGERDGV